MMRNWSWLLISVAAAAHAEPPRQLEYAQDAFIAVRLLIVEKDGTRYEQLATRVSQ